VLIAEDWRFDGYRWKQIGKSHIPRKDPKLTKIHYQLKTANGLSKEFRKSVYKVHEKPEVLVVQYIGNADAAEDLPHGNAKKPVNFLPVAKALTTQLEEKTSKLADICAETVHEQEQFQPRNKNQKRYFERKSQLNTDSFLVLHEMAYTFPDFIWKIATYPDLTVTFGLPQFFNLLETSCTSDIMFSYDTTFNLGDFYLTTLVVQLHSFAEKPIIPIAFMLHERKFQSLHEDFCASVYEMMPNRIKGQAFNACTDGEAGCSNAISKVFPSWNVFQCWNHIVTDVEFWLKKHGATNDELAVYKTQMRSLLASETDEDYKMTKQSYQETWSQAFRDYYVAYVEPRVCSSYRHRLKECGLKADSITTNNSESLNAVLKRYSTHIEENAKFVQIVHDAPREHWVVATNRGCGADTIRIYCSIGMKPSDKCMQSILCCVRSKAEKVHIQVMNIAKQQGGKDCCLYSIAVATLLMFEKDPTAVVFKQECMRDHLTSCLRGEAMSEFPCTTNRVVRHKIAIKYDVAVYCICRGGGFSMERMISCDNCHSWYHIRCVGKTDEQFAVYATDRSKRYHCMNCMN